MADGDGIPSFLIIPQEGRKEAWEKLEKFRAERKLPLEVKPTFKPITGDQPDVDDKP